MSAVAAAQRAANTRSFPVKHILKPALGGMLAAFVLATFIAAMFTEGHPKTMP